MKFLYYIWWLLLKIWNSVYFNVLIILKGYNDKSFIKWIFLLKIDVVKVLLDELNDFNVICDWVGVCVLNDWVFYL